LNLFKALISILIDVISILDAGAASVDHFLLADFWAPIKTLLKISTLRWGPAARAHRAEQGGSSHGVSALELLFQLSRGGEMVEDLLEGRLGDGILAQHVLVFVVLDQAEHGADGCLAISLQLQLPRVAPVLDNLRVGEPRRQHVDELLPVVLRKLPLEELFKIDDHLLFLHCTELEANSIWVQFLRQFGSACRLKVVFAFGHVQRDAVQLPGVVGQ